MDFLVISSSSRLADVGDARLQDRLKRLRSVATAEQADGSMILALQDCPVARSDDGSILVGRQQILLDYENLGTRTVSQLLRGIDGHQTLLRRLTSGLAPFAFAYCSGRSDEVLAIPDYIGLSALFYVERADSVLISSSSTLLAWLTGASFDEEALVHFSLFGQYAFNRTSFDSVRKIPSGTYAAARGGKLRLVSYGPLNEAKYERLAQDHPERAGASLLRDIVSGFVRAVPDSDLDLSGGLDSRIILAAMSLEERRNRRALTIGTPASGDVEIARRISAECRLNHQVVDLQPLSKLDPTAALALLGDAALLYDFMGNPIDRAVGIFVERATLGGARFTGQNGEMARGFFYPFFNVNQPRGSADVERLLKWRLIANDRADPDLFNRSIYADFEKSALEYLGQSWPSRSAVLGDDLDTLYLDFRMVGWCGNAFSVAQAHRTIIAPFFDPRFITWVRGMRPAQKRNSRVFARVLQCLDGSLHQIPFDNGVLPAVYSGHLIRRWAGYAALAGKKTLRKLRQRFVGAAAGTIMSDVLLRHLADNRHIWLDPERLAEGVPLLHVPTLEAYASGKKTLDRPTASVLFNIATCQNAMASGDIPLRPFLKLPKQFGM